MLHLHSHHINTGNLTSDHALCLKSNSAKRGFCCQSSPQGGHFDRAWGDGHNIDKASQSHTCLNKELGLAGPPAAPTSRVNGEAERSTRALNSDHLHTEGHWQRLKQLNIPPSVALTPTSQQLQPSASLDSAANTTPFFSTSAYHNSSQVKQHISSVRAKHPLMLRQHLPALVITHTRHLQVF